MHSSVALPDMSQLALKTAPTSMKRSAPGSAAPEQSGWNYGKWGVNWWRGPNPEKIFDSNGRAIRPGWGPWPLDDDARNWTVKWYQAGEYHPYLRPYTGRDGSYMSGSHPFYNPNEPYLNTTREAFESQSANKTEQPSSSRQRQTPSATDVQEAQEAFSRQMNTRFAFDAAASFQAGNGRPWWGDTYVKQMSDAYDRNRKHRALAEEADAATRKNARYSDQKYDPELPFASPSMSAMQYLVFRRAYEFKAIVAKEIADYKRRNPRGVPPGGVRVDLMGWPNPQPGRTDYDAMPGAYYAIEPGKLYMINLENPANFPDPEITRRAVEAERVRKQQEDERVAAEKARRDAEEAAAMAAAKKDADDRAAAAKAQKEREEAEAAAEANRQAIIQFVGVEKDGLLLYDSHVVIPLNDKHADGFYQSICLLRRMRGEGPLEKPPGIPDWSPAPVMQLRQLALKWLYTSTSDRDDPRFKLLRANDNFRRYLRGENNEDSDYPLGMIRAMAYINDWRQKANNKEPWDAWGEPIDGPPGAIAPNATAGERDKVRSEALIGQYYQVQRLPKSWPTLYDVEALAWRLERPIHLYTNGDQEGTGPHEQDWMRMEPAIELGPPLRDADQPYRLLWSGDQLMRFRPLVDKGRDPQNQAVLRAKEIEASGACANPYLKPTRNDRITKSIPGMPSNYYEVVEQFAPEYSL